MNQAAFKRVIFSGFTFWTLLAAVSIVVLYPLNKKLKRGIDLAGGTYITLSVETDKALESLLLDKLESVLASLKSSGKELPIKNSVVGNSIVLTFKSVADTQAAAIHLKGFDRELTQTTDNDELRISFVESVANYIAHEAVVKNIEVLRTRLDGLGVGEILIAAQGERNIVVELPGISDPQEAKAMIGTAAVLEFKLVEKSGSSVEDLLYDTDGEMPSGFEVVKGRGDATYYLVPRRAVVTGKYLKNAAPQWNEKGQPVVAFEFSGEGAEKFYKLTSENIGRTLAAILDGVVVTAANINSGIRNSGVIEGSFTFERAKELSTLFKSGSFIAPVVYEEERQVGPTLGAEAIRQGFLSCFVSLGLLFLFSIFFYSFAGLLAFITLLYNIIFILLGLYLIDAVLTLPGIGGIVLTVGMAIDASILIYERIKEELASGVSIRKAVDDGFSDAMRVILDSNITTFIVGFVLYMFGTGPIKGFAITLMLGIISTLITGLFFLKSMFNVMLNNFNIQKLKI